MALSDTNSIAYSKPLRDQLKEVHNLLGEEATDAANTAMGMSEAGVTEIDKVIKSMSTLASTVSSLLYDAKVAKELNEGEEADYEMIGKFAKKLGNAQFELLDLIRDINELNTLSHQISEKGMKAANSIVDLQEELMKVRSSMNAVGIYSQNPKLAELFELEQEENGTDQ